MFIKILTSSSLILFFVLAFLVLIKLGPKHKKYLELYQEKMDLKHSLVGDKVNKEYLNDPIGFMGRSPLMIFKVYKAIFWHVKDGELKNAQKEVRKYLIFFLLCGIGMMASVSLGVLLQKYLGVN